MLDLPPSITIHSVPSLRTRLLDCIGAATVVIDGSRVGEIDTAGLQLLLAARRSVESCGGRLRWQSLTPALASAARMLGLERDLGIGGDPG